MFLKMKVNWLNYSTLFLNDTLNLLI